MSVATPFVAMGWFPACVPTAGAASSAITVDLSTAGNIYWNIEQMSLRWSVNITAGPAWNHTYSGAITGNVTTAPRERVCFVAPLEGGSFFSVTATTTDGPYLSGILEWYSLDSVYYEEPNYRFDYQYRHEGDAVVVTGETSVDWKLGTTSSQSGFTQRDSATVSIFGQVVTYYLLVDNDEAANDGSIVSLTTSEVYFSYP